MKKTVLLLAALFFVFASWAQQNRSFISKAGLARDFIKPQAIAAGVSAADIDQMKISSETYSKQSGVTNVYFQQTVNGIPVFNAMLNVHVTRDNKLLTYGNRFVKVDDAVRSRMGNPLLSPEQALKAAMTTLGIAPAGSLNKKVSGSAPVYLTVFDKGKLALEDIKVQLVYQPMEEKIAIQKAEKVKLPQQSESLRLAWQVEIYTADAKNYWSARIDAATGELLDKNNYVVTCDFGQANNESCNHAVNQPHQNGLTTTYSFLNFTSTNNPVGSNDYRVYQAPVESPNHTTPLPPADGRTLVSNPANVIASPFGWHDTNGAAGAEFTTTQGNNAHAYTDIDFNNVPDAGSSPDGGVNLVFDFPLDLSQAPSTYRPAAVTNLFYWNNYIHDFAYGFGFDELSGNFQENNYGNGGLGSDYVQAEAQDGSGTNNANFATPPDGSNPRMQMFIGTNPTPDVDGDLDNAVIAHEYAHGISNRLTGGPATTSCLSNAEQMGEGWSDFYGYMLTMKPTDVGTAARGIGTYLFGQPANGPGIRPTPYSTNMAVNPSTYNTINTAAIPHGVGYVWASMLWDLNWKMIDVYGFNDGFNKTMQLVMNGMKLQPCSPGFVDGRNAILAADQALYNGANKCLIWEVFARRGLGFSATQGSTSSTTDGVQAFDLNPSCLTVPVMNSAGAAITAESCTPPNSAIDPNETVSVNLSLLNVGGVNTTNLVATLQATGGVTSPSGPQNYGVLVAGGASVSRPFTFTADNLTCGDQLTATLQLQDGASNLGTVTYTFTIGADVVITSENFDGVSAPALPSGWTATNVIGAGALWVTSSAGLPAPVAASAPNSIAIDDPATISDKEIVTPSFIPNAGSKLSFVNNYNLESTFDGGVLEISINGGAFTDIIAAGGSFITGGYNGTISAAFQSPIAGRSAWTGNSSGFKTTKVDLPAAAVGFPCQLKFRMGSDNSVSGQGWRLDDIAISHLVCCTAPVCTPPVITAPTVTQPTCLVPTGTIVVNATGNSPLEYSVDNGNNWQPSATFSGLAPSNYNIISVRHISNITCASTYGGNPVVIHATVSPVVGIAADGPIEFCAGGSVNLSAVVVYPNFLRVNTPYAIDMSIGTSPTIGPPITTTPVNGDFVYIPDGTASYLGCNPYTAGSLTGKVALIDRGVCFFAVKVKNAQDAGAIAVIIVNNQGTTPVNMISADPTITIPVISVSQADGAILKNMIAQGTTNGNTLQHTYSYLWSTGATTETINVTQSGNFSVQATDENGCSGSFGPLTVTVNPVPDAVGTPASQNSCSGSAITTIAISGSVTGTVFNWTRDNMVDVTGIAASGTGDISGTLTNNTAAPVTVTFTITPSYTNGAVTCTGAAITATVTVNPALHFACPGNMVETITDVICFKAVNTPYPVICGTLTKLTWKLTGATVLNSPTSGINYLGLRNMNVGTTMVTYTATFTGGIVKTCSFTVLVIETIPPNILCPPDIHVNTTAGQCYRNGPVSLGTPTVTDNCGIASVTNNAPAVYQRGVNFVTWTVTDKSGNTRTCVQRVTVNDVEKPTITCPANVIANTGPVCTATPVTLPPPVFNDNCGVTKLIWAMTGVTSGGSPNTGINFVPTMNYATGVSTIVYTAFDETGNARTCTFTVTLKDVTPPTLVCPPAQTFCKVANNTYTVPPLVQSDNCVIALTSFRITGATSRTGSGTEASGIFNQGISTITWTVKDVNGNTSICTTTVTVLPTSNTYCTPLPLTESGENPKYKPAETISGLSVTAWPNPTSSYFNLKVNTQAKEAVEIRMMDMTGKLVQVRKGLPGETYQFGSNVVTGVYFLEVSQGGKTVRTKVVKQ